MLKEFGRYVWRSDSEFSENSERDFSALPGATKASGSMPCTTPGWNGMPPLSAKAVMTHKLFCSKRNSNPKNSNLFHSKMSKEFAGKVATRLPSDPKRQQSVRIGACTTPGRNGIPPPSANDRSTLTNESSRIHGNLASRWPGSPISLLESREMLAPC